MIQYLLESSGIDLWHVGTEGEAHFRVPQTKFKRMKSYHSRCKAVASIDGFVRQLERKVKEVSQKGWFEQYVSAAIRPTQCTVKLSHHFLRGKIASVTLIIQGTRGLHAV